MQKRLVIGMVLAMFVRTLYAGNLGHRLGGDYFDFLPENSLIVFKAAIEGWEGASPIMDLKGYAYSEFDVQETYDNQLVVFHDKDFKRMLPYKGANKKIYKNIIEKIKQRTGKKYHYKKLRVKLLTLEEIQSLWLKGNYDQRVPTLEDILQLAADLRVTKPMIVEIKRLHSDKGREELFRLVKKYKDEYGDGADLVFTKEYNYPKNFSITFLAFPKKFKSSFPDYQTKSTYCQLIRDFKLGGVYRAGKHKSDLCRKYLF